jgi:hypothetical protein
MELATCSKSIRSAGNAGIGFAFPSRRWPLPRLQGVPETTVAEQLKRIARRNSRQVSLSSRVFPVPLQSARPPGRRRRHLQGFGSLQHTPAGSVHWRQACLTRLGSVLRVSTLSTAFARSSVGSRVSDHRRSWDSALRSLDPPARCPTCSQIKLTHMALDRPCTGANASRTGAPSPSGSTLRKSLPRGSLLATSPRRMLPWAFSLPGHSAGAPCPRGLLPRACLGKGSPPGRRGTTEYQSAPGSPDSATASCNEDGQPS